MANRTVPAERLKEGSVILVSGNLTFSRLAAPISGQALAESVARQKAQGRLYPTTAPHTTVTLTNARVIISDPSGVPTPEETFVQESLYTSKSGDNAGQIGYSIDNTGAILPTVLERNEDGTYSQIILERDLAPGLDVTLVLNVFKPKDYEKRGIGIQQVLVNEPVKFYGGGLDMAALAARGIVISGPVRTVNAEDAPQAAVAHTATVGAPSLPGNTVIENGLPLPGPTVAASVAEVHAAPVTPVHVQTPAQPGVESEAQKIARLEQELAATRAAAVNSGTGNSPFDAAPGDSPWNQPPVPGIQYQG
ncbi:hypothetical protein [Arthrobacter bambusae]|uniref:Uncharacterized protein n=1 Tax=Arthrobacter bambusae TaxID=1338426 RepID=A0AAW8DDM8_9MICC|nr:hypothetical protein [Arthrobacter bambusae]MDP9903179.1 hypothetical protein [Arthrobacter bambusae]MDQ0128827.1 hypothetical protein [Arthrobacter bambusae]MDQ0180168.1 hypothetical protein [Arthrobacter bambusae]